MHLALPGTRWLFGRQLSPWDRREAAEENATEDAATRPGSDTRGNHDRAPLPSFATPENCAGHIYRG